MQDGDAATLVARRREQAAARWNLDRGVVLLPAGLMLPVAGTDQYHEYHAHPEHRYLAGVGQAGGVLAFDAGEGWTLFVPQPEAGERVWTGDGPSLAGVAEVSGLEQVRPASELGGWLERRRGEPLAVIGNATSRCGRRSTASSRGPASSSRRTRRRGSVFAPWSPSCDAPKTRASSRSCGKRLTPRTADTWPGCARRARACRSGRCRSRSRSSSSGRGRSAPPTARLSAAGRTRPRCTWRRPRENSGRAN